MTHAVEILREASVQLPHLCEEGVDFRRALELNYRVRKVAESLIALSRDREDILKKAVDIYMRLGDNYQLFDASPELAVETLNEVVCELEKLVRELGYR